MLFSECTGPSCWHWPSDPPQPSEPSKPPRGSSTAERRSAASARGAAFMGGLSAAWVPFLEGLSAADIALKPVFLLPSNLTRRHPWLCSPMGWTAAVMPDGSVLAGARNGGHHCGGNGSYPNWPVAPPPPPPPNRNNKAMAAFALLVRSGERGADARAARHVPILDPRHRPIVPKRRASAIAAVSAMRPLPQRIIACRDSHNQDEPE